MNKRITVCQPGAQSGKVITIDSDVTMQVLLEQIELKTGWKLDKLFTCNGDEVVDAGAIRDEERVFKRHPLNGTSLGLPSDWLSLNVGGKVFMVSRNTLLNCRDACTSLLNTMFLPDSGLQSSDRDASGAYLIDRNPEYFEPILDYIRTGFFVKTNGISLLHLRREAQYFGIESMAAHVEELRRRQLSVAVVTFVVHGKRFRIAREALLNFQDAKTCLLSRMVCEEFTTSGELDPTNIYALDPILAHKRNTIENYEVDCSLIHNVRPTPAYELDPTNLYSLDCSPDRFETILHFIRTGSVLLTDNLQPHVVFREALYLKVMSLLPLLADRDQFVTFDCGGVILTTLKSTFNVCAVKHKCDLCVIVRAHLQDRPFQCCVENWQGESFLMPENEEGAIVLPRDAKIFGPFLRFHELRSKGCGMDSFPKVFDCGSHEVVREAQYFGFEEHYGLEEVKMFLGQL